MACLACLNANVSLSWEMYLNQICDIIATHRATRRPISAHIGQHHSIETRDAQAVPAWKDAGICIVFETHGTLCVSCVRSFICCSWLRYCDRCSWHCYCWHYCCSSIWPSGAARSCCRCSAHWKISQTSSLLGPTSHIWPRLSDLHPRPWLSPNLHPRLWLSPDLHPRPWLSPDLHPKPWLWHCNNKHSLTPAKRIMLLTTITAIALKRGDVYSAAMDLVPGRPFVMLLQVAESLRLTIAIAVIH